MLQRERYSRATIAAILVMSSSVVASAHDRPRASRLAAAAVDSEGDSSPAMVLVNDGAARFSAVPRAVQPSSADSRREAPPRAPHDAAEVTVAWADVDGDADLDLVIMDARGEGTHVLRREDSGFAARSEPLPELARRSILVAPRDVDGDTIVDGARVMDAVPPLVGDLDGDLDADLLLVRGMPAGPVMLLSEGESWRNASAHLPLDGWDVVVSSRLMDVDGDGDLDIVPASLDERARTGDGDIPDAGQSPAAPMSLGSPDSDTGFREPDLGGVDPGGREVRPFDHVGDHGIDNSAASLLDDDHPRYLNTEADDTFSDGSWVVYADTTTSSHTKQAILAGGGSPGSTSTGGIIVLNGNNSTNVEGHVALTSGSATGARTNLNCFGASGGWVSVRYNPNQASTPEGHLTLDTSGMYYENTLDKPFHLGEDIALEFEGDTSDAYETTLRAADPTQADRLIILPDATGTVAVDASSPLNLDSAGRLTCADCALKSATKFVDLTCFTRSETTWGEFTLLEQTAVGTGTETQSAGFNFADNVDREIQCHFIVPDDYDPDSATKPAVRLMGWSTDCVICVPGVTCSQSRYVEFEVSSRAYSAGERANAAWNTISTVTMQWTSESCGNPCSTNCWQSDRVKVATADAAPSAGYWAIGELAFIRILRDVDTTDDLPSTFHLSRVRLAYTGK